MNFGLLLLRLIVGGLMAGHGAQKLFGKFGGYGLEGTAGFMESLNMKPGRQWAMAAGGSEFGGGVLTLLGLLNPLGPIGVASAMGAATAKAHWGKPIWGTSGGAELPLVNAAAVATLAFAGPGAISLDGLLGIKTPKWLTALALIGAVAGLARTVSTGLATPEPSQEEATAAEVQAGEEAQHSV